MLLFILPAKLTAQSIAITGGVRTYPTLSSANVTMTGKSELRITGAATPISGCTIDLASQDAYLVFTAVKPSTVATTTYLNQIRINGAAAVADSNCRVVQYAMGTIVAPHASNFQPLTIFSGPNFTGTSSTLGLWTYYKGDLGALYANVSSFKLKRGYMAVMAQAENGAGVSRCYIAADGDMEVSLLPGSLDNNIRFIHITPWRWVSKKGAAGWISNQFMNQVQSWYNWRGIENSTRDREYTAMQWAPFLPNLDEYNWKNAQVNTILGYNEPDRPDQSRMSVASGVTHWAKLQEYGLRLGSPVPAEGGNWWLSDFMSQAAANDLRVDFIAVHRYSCYNPAGDPEVAATQLIDALKSIYNEYGKPIWLTEWNSGAGWTNCGDPTRDQHAALIEAMTRRMDQAPWVERYQIYSWVEGSRNVTDGSGNLYAAGTKYVNLQSPVGYMQVLPDNGTRNAAELPFENNVLDSSGYGNNGMETGSPVYTAGKHGQAILFDGATTHVTLPANVATSSTFTFAAWVRWDGGASWQRIFDFGNDETHYMFLTPKAGSGNIRFEIANGTGTTQGFDAGVLPVNQWVHVAVTLSGGTARVYKDGVQTGSASITLTPASFKGRVNTLGRSQFFQDPKFQGAMDDVFITDSALSATAIQTLMNNAAPAFSSNLITRGAVSANTAFSNTLAGTASDTDGASLTYSKVNGPAWLTVSSSGVMSGTPTSSDRGTNYFTVSVTDSAGQRAFTTVTVDVTATTFADSAVWGVNASANWSTTASWTNNTPPAGAGQTAAFNAIDITADRTVTLDGDRTIGTLTFGDTSGAQTWTLTGSSTLTMDPGTSGSPRIEVEEAADVALVSAKLGGSSGLTKSGAGRLILSGNNMYLNGPVNVSAGALTIRNNFALGTGQLTLNGGEIYHNNGSYLVDNPVHLATASTFNITSGTKLTLTGAISNAGGSLIKSGEGTLMLAGHSTYTGNTILNAGTLDIGADDTRVLGYSTLIINGGALDNTAVRTFGIGADNAQVWNGDFSFLGTEDLDLGSGPITVNGARQISVNAKVLRHSGVIGGGGGITKAGDGILYLAGSNDNTYSGGTTIVAGEVQIADSQALGTGLVTFSGGTLSARGAGRTVANPAKIDGDFVLNGANGGSNLLTLSGTVNLSGDTRTITVGATAASMTGSISNGGLTKAGSGTLTLGGANSHTGDTRIAAGTLALTNALALQNSTLDLNALDAGGLSFGTLTSATFGGLKGARNLGMINSSSAAVALTVGGNSQISEYSGILSGTGRLVKAGSSNALLLNGQNTYTGITTISGGELAVNGTTGSGTVTVSGGAALSGKGMITGSLSALSGSQVRVGEVLAVTPQPTIALVDDFSAYPVGAVGATPNTTGNLWTGVHNGTANAVIVDNAGNRALSVYGTGTAWRGAISDLRTGRTADFSLPHGQTGTYFFRIRRTGMAFVEAVFGLSDSVASTATPPGNDTTSPNDEYAITLSLYGDSTNCVLRAYDPSDNEVTVSAVATGQWINVWIVADNLTKTYRVATSTGTSAATDSGRSYSFGRRTASTVSTNPLVTFGVHEARNTAIQIDDLRFTRGADLSSPHNPQSQLVSQVGTLTVQGGVTLAADSTIEFDLFSKTLYDRFVIGGPLNANGILKVVAKPTLPSLTVGDSFDLFDAGTASINFSSLNLPTLPTGLKWNTSGISTGVISVVNDYTPYQLWQQTHFGANWSNPPVAGGQADPDGDGTANLLEWALDMDPTVADASAWTNGKPGLPTQGTINEGGESYLALHVRRPIGRSDIFYSGEVSGDLINWNPAAQGIPTNNGDGSETVTFQDTVPLGDTSRRFLRLRVSQQ